MNSHLDAHEGRARVSAQLVYFMCCSLGSLLYSNARSHLAAIKLTVMLIRRRHCKDSFCRRSVPLGLGVL